MTNAQLITDLTARTEYCLSTARGFRNLTDADLNRREAADRWSILECLEHLNRYGDFYNPAIRNAIKGAKPVKANHDFTPGWMGNRFALSMLPLPEGGKKMKTFKKMNPIGSSLSRSILEKFLDQQQELLELLPRCERVDLVKLTTGITLTRFIQLRLGDTLRVVIYHNQRHVQQATGVVESLGLRAPSSESAGA